MKELRLGWIMVWWIPEPELVVVEILPPSPVGTDDRYSSW